MKIKSIIAGFATLLLFLIGMLIFLLMTTRGLHTSVRIANLFLPGTIRVTALTGNLFHHLTFEEIDYVDGQIHIQLMHGVLDWQGTSIRNKQFVINTLHVAQVRVSHPHQQIQLGNMNITGNITHYQWQADLQGLGQGRLHGFLGYNEHREPKFQGDIQSTPLDLGALIPLTQMTLNAQFFGSSLSTLSANIHFRAHYLNAMLHADAHIQPTKMDALIRLGDNTLEITRRIPYPWQAKLVAPQPQFLDPSIRGLQTTITAHATLRALDDGECHVTIGPGQYQSPQDRTLPNIPFNGGNLDGFLTANGLKLSGLFTFDEYKSMHLAFRLPQFQINTQNYALQKIDGTLQVNLNSLDFLQGLSPIIANPHGQLRMNLNAAGTLQKPMVKGELLLSNGQVSIPKSGLTFGPIQASLQSNNNQWVAHGSIAANGKTLALVGKGEFSPMVTGRLTIDGDDFPAMKTAEYTIHLSPQLIVQFTPTTLRVTGSIQVPFAELKPVSFSNSVNLTDDAVFIDKINTPATSLNMTSDINVTMGKHVHIDLEGLHGYLDGGIRMNQTPGTPMSAMGELTIRDGKYHAYGQDLTIEQGKLFYTGGAIDDPGIQIRAIRKFNNTTSGFTGSNQLLDFNTANLDTIDFGDKTTVGIELTGRLTSHKITLFSIPATLSQADILSMLILGKPASQANQSGKQLLIAAISSMNLDSGTKGMQLLEQLKQKLGIDFSVENNSQYNQQTDQMTDNTALVVGKAITKRLYVTYNIGIFQENSSVLTLKYLLNKFFSIQVSASYNANGIDLLYTHK